jgi:predicted Rossmann-fold nucleotide-binding protein
MNVLVCGGRNYRNARVVATVLGEFASVRGITLLIEGGAMGADRLARLWAQRRGIHVVTVNALWHTYKKRAGPMRNAAMLALRPDAVIAFPGARGTADMMQQAHAQGVEVIEVVDV